MKKILFSVLVLKGIGGIESSLLNLINNLPETEYAIDLCIMGNYRSENTKIPDKVRVIKGNRILEFCCTEFSDLKKYIPKYLLPIVAIVKVLKSRIGYRPILKLCLRFMKNPNIYDAAISYSNDKFYDGKFIGGCDDYILRCCNGKKKIAWIHNDARKHGLTHDICKEKYRDFDYIVNVSEGCKKIFDEIIPEYIDKSLVVTNMLDLEEIKARKSTESPFSQEKLNLVTVARIENRQKRIDRIIECCKLFRDSEVHNVFWTVVGDGEDLYEMKQKAENERLSEYLQFVGRKLNTIPYMQHADLFIQTSDYEAYSMVLIEALAVGCPCVCTNYESADNIITDGMNGWLVEKNENAIYKKIIELLCNPEKISDVRTNCISSCKHLNDMAMNSFQDALNH